MNLGARNIHFYYQQLFSEATFGERRPWNACYTFLKACQRYKNDSKWTVPSHLAAILQQIQTLIASQEQAKVDNIEDVQSLIRVRNGPSFVFAVCVQRSSLLYLSSHFFHLPASRQSRSHRHRRRRILTFHKVHKVRVAAILPRGPNVAS